jgi:hypothetical protein
VYSQKKKTVPPGTRCKKAGQVTVDSRLGRFRLRKVVGGAFRGHCETLNLIWPQLENLLNHDPSCMVLRGINLHCSQPCLRNGCNSTDWCRIGRLRLSKLSAGSGHSKEVAATGCCFQMMQ